MALRLVMAPSQPPSLNLMTLTKAFLESELAGLLQTRQQLSVNLEATSGAIQLCQYLIKKCDEVEEPKGMRPELVAVGASDE